MHTPANLTSTTQTRTLLYSSRYIHVEQPLTIPAEKQVVLPFHGLLIRKD